MINRDIFFTKIISLLFIRPHGVKQRKGITAILDQWEAISMSGDLRYLAYILATTHHETARTMQPIRERGGAAYLRKLYDITGARPVLARANGNSEPGDGVRFAGRGFVQLTWKNNYKRAGDKLGIDLINSPDRALELVVATNILFAGMKEGWFTGKKLADYFSPTKTDWINARRIINGLDKANLIAGLAKTYFSALSDASGCTVIGKTVPSTRKTIKPLNVKVPTALRPRQRPVQPAKRSL